MSTLIYCDQDDCQNSCHSYDGEIYDISYKISDTLSKFVGGGQHICKECVEMWKEDYPNLFFINRLDQAIMHKDFKDK